MEHYKEKYEKALERAKNYHEGHTLDVNPKSAMEYVFPELKESEDERIKKAVIEFIRQNKSFTHCKGVSKADCLAWIEKQSKQNSAYKIEPKFKVGDKIKLAEEPKYPAREIIAIKNDAYCFDKLEQLPFINQDKWELVEQSPVNNIKPKFKVGDWIVYCNEDVDIITGIEETGYLVNEGGYIPFTCQGDMRLWTIRDAKDGDVLATNDDSICIFDGTVEEGKYPFAYCGLTKYGFESYDRRLPFTHDNVCPATKEQRDLLFTKMREVGYNVDDKKKELKKVEQKLIPTWSEDDERYYESAIWHIEKSCGKNGNIYDWLKSIKERMKGGII